MQLWNLGGDRAYSLLEWSRAREDLAAIVDFLFWIPCRGLCEIHRRAARNGLGRKIPLGMDRSDSRQQPGKVDPWR